MPEAVQLVLEVAIAGTSLGEYVLTTCTTEPVGNWEAKVFGNPADVTALRD